jgi:hypothetical protein
MMVSSYSILRMQAMKIGTLATQSAMAVTVATAAAVETLAKVGRAATATLKLVRVEQ